MSILPSVRAVLGERFIVNFRMKPDALKKYLQSVAPIDWLRPQEINGWAIASYCLLDLHNLTVAPLPAVAGLHSLSCAPRYAVIDTSGADEKPAVFLTERFTNSSFGAWFTGLGFSAPHPLVQAVIEHDGHTTALRVHQTGDAREELFAANVQATDQCTSTVWQTTQEFVDFIAQGVSSYGMSRHAGRLTKLDLHKTDASYEPLEVLSLSGSVVAEWQACGATFDSAFRTQGGRYEWAYHGLTDL